MMSVADIFLEYVCPLGGVITAAVMFSAPYRDVKKCTAEASLGSLNPTPWAFMLGNCIGFIAYAFLLRNWFILWGNIPGLLLAVWLNLQASKLRYKEHHDKHTRRSIIEALDEESKAFTLPAKMNTDNCSDNSDTVSDDEITKDRGVGAALLDYSRIVWSVSSLQTPVAPATHENLVMGMVVFWITLISIVAMVPTIPSDVKELIIGLAVNLNLVFFYAAPLSTIYTVLRERNSRSIHIRTMLTNLINGSFWCIYGFVIMDPFIFAPNGMGAALSVVQVLLCVVFPRTVAAEAKEGTETQVTNADVHSVLNSIENADVEAPLVDNMKSAGSDTTKSA